MLNVTVVNQKGGVGKTTTCVNLGAELAAAGYKVLLVDCDPQGNCSGAFGYQRRYDRENTIYEVLTQDADPIQALRPTDYENLTLLPSNIMLAGAELELANAVCRESLLKRALESVSEGFDIALIDCPPSLGLLTTNGLAAAHQLLVPVQSEFFALEGLALLQHSINKLSQGLRQELSIGSLLITLYDGRTNLAQEVCQELISVYGERVLNTRIPRNVSLAEAPGFAVPVRVHAPNSPGARAYKELAQEVTDRWGLRKNV